MKKSQSLVVQMLAVFIVLLVLPISVAGFYLYSEISDNLLRMEKERVKVSSKATENLVHKLGDSLLDINQGYSYWEESRVAVEEQNLTWIEENVNVGFKTNLNISFISTTDLSGNVISQVGEVPEFKKKISSEDIIERVEQKGDFSGLINTSKGLAVISVSKVTNDDGTAKATGYMLFGRILDNKALLEMKETLSDDIAMLSENNDFLTTSDSVNKADLTNYYNRVQKDGNSIFETSKLESVDNSHLITTLEDFSGKSIGILYINQKQPTSTAVKADLIINNLIIIGILIGIMVLLAVLVIRRVIFPIQKLVSFSEGMSKGNLQTELSTNLSKRKDEIGQLGNVMNIMRSNFQDLIKEVSSSIDQVATTSEELSTSSEETSKATYEITEAIQEVASGSDTQLTGALSSLHALEKLTSDIHQIAATVTDVSADSKNTESKAIVGSEVIQEAVQQMKKIDVSFAESATVVQQLANRSQEIGQMADLIKSIANQTNLLALNAAIEAARAGEHGKGFSVVAEEVRKLAEQTAQSAEQVSSLVHIIQKDSSSSVTSMKKVTNEVKEGLDQIQEMGIVFEQILVSAQQVAEKTNEVSVVSKQMEKQTGEVTLTAERTAEIAKNSTRSSQSVARASQEQLAAIEEISASYQTLTNMALNLKEQISKFQI